MRIISLAASLPLLASPALADPLYNATPLTIPSTVQPVVEGLDNNGQVLLWNPYAPAGNPSYSLYNSQAGGTITTLATKNRLFAGNPVRRPVHQRQRHYGRLCGSQAVVESGGQYTNIPSYPLAVNDSGQVGYENRNYAYIVSNGTITNLGLVPGSQTTNISGLNNSGQAAANAIGPAADGSSLTTQALFYNGQRLIPLGTFGGLVSNATAINNHGDVIGNASNSSGVYIGFVSHNGGPLVSLGTLPGSYMSQPEAINDHGQIVGQALVQSATLGNGGAFLYQSGTLMDLSKLLSPSASNITLVNAYAINNAGDIVAEGYLNTQLNPKLQLFYLTPEGEPIPLSPDPLIQTVQETPEPHLGDFRAHDRRDGRWPATAPDDRPGPIRI